MTLMLKISELAQLGISLVTVRHITELFRLSRANFGIPKLDDTIYILFENGVLNPETKEFFSHSPEFFLTTSIGFNWDPSCPTTVFFKYLDDFTQGNKDYKLFIQAFLQSLVKKQNKAQIFLVVIGPGGSGKTILAHVMTALAGKERTGTTGLKRLETDPFENSTLINKHLILANEAEEYHGTANNLKAFVGSDMLKASEKHKNDPKTAYYKGQVVIIGNNPLTINDPGGSVLRRVRLIKALNVCQERKDLLSWSAGGWNGDIVPELPGIMAWALSMDKDRAHAILDRTHELLPTMATNREAFKDVCMPLTSWIKKS
uniref:Uncharacterized protein ORF316 n=1 Tax=Phaeoceros laevis TaxID=37308 RepID=D3J0I4_9EMBR|nr:hypothetical protein PhlaMp11 [Phaeoceros laevis]ACT75298.1 hypothetical protein PhlaMp11 [Phaeoceros laevis]